MDRRTVIISDLHLGPPDGAVGSADQVRPLWKGAERLVLNGDCAEIHHPTHKPRATKQLARLVELCAIDGVDVDVLAGNHDPWISARRRLELAHGAVFVTHGDALHPAIAPWVPTADLMKSAFERAMADHAETGGIDGLDARLDAARQAAYVEWEALEEQATKRPVLELLKRPWAVFKILDYWRRIPGLAVEFLTEHAPDARFLVFGHTHHAGIWTIDGRTLINTGSFDFPSRPRAVVVDRNHLAVYRILKKDGLWVRSDRPIAEFEISFPTTAGQS